MPRSIRIEFPGAFFHVMARGNRRGCIFEAEDDRRLFVDTLGEACAKAGWRVHAWVLMDTHYHALIATPEANLVAGMKWLQNTYTRRFNTRHRFWGRLFGDRYKAVLVEGGGYYYQTLLDYIHLNPVRSGVIDASKKQSVMDYPWSSIAGGYALPPGKRPKWLAASEGLAEFGCSDTAAGRRGFVERLDRRAVEEGMERAGLPVLEAEADRRCSHLRRGWYWGSQAFAERMLALGQAALGKPRHRAYQASGESRAHGEREAERLLEEGLRAAGLARGTLAALSGSDKRKVAIAKVIWEQTVVSQSWIAEKLFMKSPANASQQIRRHRCAAKDVPRSLWKWINLSRYVA